MKTLPWQRSVRLTGKMASKFKMNEDFRALKDALENLNTGKSPSRRILKGIFSNNTETCELIGQNRPCHGFRRHLDE